MSDLRDSGLCLPGWNCAHCLSFNGEAKEPRSECRACGAARASFGLPLESVLRHARLLEENLASVHERCDELLEAERAQRRRATLAADALRDIESMANVAIAWDGSLESLQAFYKKVLQRAREGLKG